jgi:hypothetical protein
VVAWPGWAGGFGGCLARAEPAGGRRLARSLQAVPLRYARVHTRVVLSLDWLRAARSDTSECRI